MRIYFGLFLKMSYRNILSSFTWTEDQRQNSFNNETETFEGLPRVSCYTREVAARKIATESSSIEIGRWTKNVNAIMRYMKFVYHIWRNSKRKEITGFPDWPLSVRLASGQLLSIRTNFSPQTILVHLWSCLGHIKLTVDHKMSV